MTAVVTTTNCLGCGNEAASSLQCPNCIKLGIEGSVFCSQACFKSSWATHKLLHSTVPAKSNTTPAATKDPYNPWPNYSYTGLLRPFYPLSPKRAVPDTIARPDYADHPKGHSACEMREKGSTEIKVLDDEEIEAMRVVCKLAREVLDVAAAAADVGVTTDEIDRLVHEATIERDCYPSPLNYYNFPKSCCTSVNEVICHGIPDQRPLENGDLLNVDITVFHRGFHGDLNETLFVGEVAPEHRKLVSVTYDAMMKAAALIRPGEKYRELGNVIQKTVSAHGYSVVRSYCGHGIHRLFHTSPQVPHYAKNKAVGIMKPGHTFTIEPMISEGVWRDRTWPDDWTAVTADGRRSAQFEQTFLVTDTGYEILTRRRANDGRPYFMDKL